MGGRIDNPYEVLKDILAGVVKPRDLPLRLLEGITDNFSEERKIGEGAFCTVYKGGLGNENVAVKKIFVNKYTVDDRQFRREVESLMVINNHPNLVRFLGFCSNTARVVKEIVKEKTGSEQIIYPQIMDRLLCFEYISNGSLDKHITDEFRGLTWDKRFDIITGICEGLRYLHEDKRIIHMDLKPTNILLDDHMVPKITDFGQSRFAENTRTQGEQGERFFTLGYCAPEYQTCGQTSDRADIYSLGVVIVELVTGTKHIPDITHVLRRWRHRWNKPPTQVQHQQLMKCMEMAVCCREQEPGNRPSISDIILHLSKTGSTNGPIGQKNLYLYDDMLGIEPLELHFSLDHKKQTSCSVQLTNETINSIAFNIRTPSKQYSTRPDKGIVLPGCKRDVKITLHPQESATQVTNYEKFVVQSTQVNDGLADEDIADHMFKSKGGKKMVDEVNLMVLYELDREDEAVSKTNLYLYDDMLGIEPLELHFSLDHKKQTSCSVQLTNETINSIAFNIRTPSKQYSTRPDKGIVLPGCKRDVKITLHPQESATQVTNYDKFVVQSTQVNEGLADEDITDRMIKSKGGKKVVHEVDLMVVYEPEKYQVDRSLDPQEEAVSKDIGSRSYKNTRYMHFNQLKSISQNLAISLTSDQTVDLATGAIESLLPKLSELLNKYNLDTRIRNDVNYVIQELRVMRADLCNVSEVQWDSDNEQIKLAKLWVCEVRELSYGIEDVVDRFLMHVEGSEAATSTGGLMEVIQNIGGAIKDIKNKLQDKAGWKGKYKVEEVFFERSKVEKVANTVSTINAHYLSALANDSSKLVGINDAMKDLTKRLRGADGNGDVYGQELEVHSIFGSGGLGKTTLARAVYNQLKRSFRLTAFVPVGRNPNVKKLLYDILFELDERRYLDLKPVDLDERQLIGVLKKLLKNNRYLIVIDDMWDKKVWDDLLEFAFVDSKCGSKIIITTRIFEVAAIATDVYKLDPLSHGYSQELFYATLSPEESRCEYDVTDEVTDEVDLMVVYELQKYQEDGSLDRQEDAVSKSGSKPSLSLQHLKDITKNFAEERILGQGSFGVVYKGLLDNGEMVAVKKLLQATPSSLGQLENELILLKTLEHKNIVRLVGHCYETEPTPTCHKGKSVFAWDTKILLCLEYLPNGSLDKYISDASSRLNWHTRWKVIEGICYGLLYLHEHSNEPIIHLDLKPANILLDENMLPKVTDFGLSRLFDQNKTIETATAGGTRGYMPPEYLRGIITPMWDIFSLGVIIMEVITGHRNYPDDIREDSKPFIEIELQKWRNRLQEEPGYTSLETDCQQIERCIQIGLVCVNHNRKKRPTIRKIIDMLKGSESMNWYISNELTPNPVATEDPVAPEDLVATAPTQK